jgi:uncharacterized membrane protein YraQ (UPF0718 family)
MNLIGAIAYAVIVILSYTYAFRKDKKIFKKALKKGTTQFFNQIFFLISMFLMISLFDVFVPKDIIAKFMGQSNGLLSILYSAFFGTIAMGSASSAYPLAGVLLKKGAPVVSVAVFLNTWVMVGLIMLPYEVSVFGKKFAFFRNTFAFFGAIAVGVAVGLLMGGSI